MPRQRRYNNIGAPLDADLDELYSRLDSVEARLERTTPNPLPPPDTGGGTPGAPGSHLTGVDISDFPVAYGTFNLPAPPSGGTSNTISSNTPSYTIPNDDHTTTIDSGVKLDLLTIPTGLNRIWIKGPGTIGRVQMSHPANDAAHTLNVTFDSLRFEPGSSLFNEFYGKRIAIVNCISAGTGYFIWMGVHAPTYEDILVYGCTGYVAGADTACMRFEGVTRLIVKNTTTYTGGRHGLRLHGTSDAAFFKNVDLRDYSGQSGNGLKIGSMGPSVPADIDRVTMDDVDSFVTGPEDMNVERNDGSVNTLSATGCSTNLPAGVWSAWETIFTAGWPGWTFNSCTRVTV